jgi:hypothetical protein
MYEMKGACPGLGTRPASCLTCPALPTARQCFGRRTKYRFPGALRVLRVAPLVLPFSGGEVFLRPLRERRKGSQANISAFSLSTGNPQATGQLFPQYGNYAPFVHNISTGHPLWSCRAINVPMAFFRHAAPTFNAVLVTRNT